MQLTSLHAVVARTLACGALSAFSLAAPLAAQSDRVTYEVVEFGLLNGLYFSGQSLSDSGEVLGTTNVVSGTQFRRVPAQWNAGVFACAEVRHLKLESFRGKPKPPQRSSTVVQCLLRQAIEHQRESACANP